MKPVPDNLKALIVDDEPLARARLRRLLGALGVTRITEAETAESAIQACTAQPPHVVFMDIEMPGANGIQATEALHQCCPDARVIFCTAYDSHAVKAFELNAQDYLLKPVNRERLQQALEKLPERRNEDSITVRVGTDLVRIPVADIHYCQADHKYVTAYHRHGEVILDESLNQLQNRFPHHFLRIHRNCLINKKRLHALQQDSQGRYCVRLTDLDCALPVSRRNLPTVRKTLKHAE